MAWCGEWPFYKEHQHREGYGTHNGLHMWFRRWSPQFGYLDRIHYVLGFPDMPDRVHHHIDELVARNVVRCHETRRIGIGGRRTEYARHHNATDLDERLRWICPDPQGVAVFMSRVGGVQIAALALCPVLAGLIALHVFFAAYGGSLGAVQCTMGFVAILGGVIVAALATCVALLADFNANGLPANGVGAPAESGWQVTPWVVVAMLVCTVLAVVSCAVSTTAASLSTTANTADVQAPSATTEAEMSRLQSATSVRGDAAATTDDAVVGFGRNDTTGTSHPASPIGTSDEQLSDVP